MLDDKIFIYLRFRDENETLLQSRIREFATIGKLLADFIKSVYDKYGFHILEKGNLEYVDANSDLVLVSFKRDLIKEKLIISGLIPKIYQRRMLDEVETVVHFSLDDFIENITDDPLEKAMVYQRVEKTPYNILHLIKENIDTYGEFYIELDKEYS